MHQKKVVVVVVYRTNLLTGHFKVYRMDEEEVVRGVEAGAGVDVGEERATSKLWLCDDRCVFCLVLLGYVGFTFVEMSDSKVWFSQQLSSLFLKTFL
ncbi:unnamed protein product [Camellia sinensis]